MKTSQKIMVIGLVTASLGATLVQAQAAPSLDATKPFQKDQGPRSQMMQFVKNNDYEGFKKWAEQNGKTKLEEKITPEKFAKMVELYNAVENKDWAKVQELKQEIGFKGPGHRFMRKSLMEGLKEQFSKLPDQVKIQLKEAFKAKDRVKIKQILEQNGITLPIMQKSSN